MKVLTLIMLLYITACNNPTSYKEKNQIDCSDSIVHVNLITASIKLPALQKYYTVQKKINQGELVILKNQYTKNTNLKSIKFNIPIRILSRNDISKNNIKAYIEYKEIDIQNDAARIYYRYDIQGIGIKTSYVLKKCNWRLINYELWEN